MASGDYHSPFRFNGKELDEETGLYYYGARYMNPRLSIWYGTDPLETKYPYLSSYSYTFGNPIQFLADDGMKPKRSRIEYRGDGVFGINIKALNRVTRNNFYRLSQDPKNWTPGEIGINTTVAKLQTLSTYDSYLFSQDYNAVGVDPNDG